MLVIPPADRPSGSPFRFRLSVDFGTTAWDPTLLSAWGQEVWGGGTLGGSSGESEAVSMDLLYRCELADLLKSEPEILYTDDGGKKTDILVTIDGAPVGVSVTRAMTYAAGDPCSAVNTEALTTLMTRKVGDLQLSQANAVPADHWDRSMLYVIACDAAHADATAAIFDALDPAVKADAILVVAVSEGDDAFLY